MVANDLELAIDEIVRQQNIAGRRVSVGLSGGCDSVCLLEVLARIASRYEIDLTAVHVNHGISGKSDDWESFCRDLSKSLKVNFESQKVLVNLKSGRGVEETARESRYGFFSNLSTDFIFLAHHLDDQVETFFLQLLRGAGVSGLSAMPRVRTPWGFKGPKLIRPWLFVERKLIVDYATHKKLSWVEDESNLDQSLDRNFLRISVLPTISNRYPGYRNCVHRTIQNIGDSEYLIGQLGEIDKHSIMDGEPGLNLYRLSKLTDKRIINLLRYIFFENGYRYPRRNLIQEVVRQLFEAKNDSQINFIINGVCLRRYRNRLYFSENKEYGVVDFSEVWTGQEEITLPNNQGSLSFNKSFGVGLSCQKIQNKLLTVRFRKGGEKMVYGRAGAKRTLKNLFQEAGIPPWLRNSMPLIFCDGELAWIPAIGYSKKFISTNHDLSVSIRWDSLPYSKNTNLDFQYTRGHIDA